MADYSGVYIGYVHIAYLPQKGGHKIASSSLNHVYKKPPFESRKKRPFILIELDRSAYKYKAFSSLVTDTYSDILEFGFKSYFIEFHSQNPVSIEFFIDQRSLVEIHEVVEFLNKIEADSFRIKNNTTNCLNKFNLIAYL